MRSIACALTVLVTVVCSHSVNAEDAVQRSAELQVLDRFVGTWDLVFTAKPREGQAATGKTSETRRWSLGGKFVLFENPHTENPDEPHFHMLLTYDPATKTYPGVMMIGASRSVLHGTWDPATNTMTFNGNSVEGGTTFSVKTRFVDKDHCESTAVLKDPKGDAFLELSQKQTRRGS